MTRYFGMLLGLLVGFALAGPAGGALGTLVGLALGLLWVGLAEPAAVPRDAVLARERHRLLCVPKGQVASATFVRDARSDRWLDVERCSLCEPEDQVGCRKRCLAMMRDTLPPRRNPVHAGARTTAAT